MFFELFGNEVASAYLDFFFLYVARDFDEFHTVEQRPRDGVQVVGRGDKQYFREVVVDVEIIVVKRIVLLRVEHFEKCRCRVALEVVAYFIDFIENEYRIGGSRFLYALNDSSRHGSDISTAMPSYFGLVVQTA